MQYRKLGKLGWEVSEIGFGPEHLDGKPYDLVEEVVEEVLRQGINIMDLFMPGAEIRRNIGRALGNRRKDMIIQGQIGSCDLTKQYEVSRDLDVCKRYFEQLLECLQTDYIDLGMLFYLDSEQDFRSVFDSPLISYAEDLKRQGVIRAIGFTSHNPITAMRVVETDLVDMMMFSINLAFDLAPSACDLLGALDGPFEDLSFQTVDPGRAALYQLCEQKNIGITVMKAYGAGKLLSKQHSPFLEPMTPGQCIHYALTRPAVKSVLVGLTSIEEIGEALRYYTLTEAERDFAHFAKNSIRSFKGSCLYCNHCLPCPAEIDIAALHRALDAARTSPPISNKVPKDYQSLAHHASDCISCGQCETRCPFSVPVIKNMQDAKTRFGY